MKRLIAVLALIGAPLDAHAADLPAQKSAPVAPVPVVTPRRRRALGQALILALRPAISREAAQRGPFAATTIFAIRVCPMTVI